MHVCNRRRDDAEVNDYYATDPKAVEILLKNEEFSHYVWEPACGEGHISNILATRNHIVKSTDLVDRGYGLGGIDFLKQHIDFHGDIITNPPYKFAKEFAEKAIETIADGHKVAMFLKLVFLEGQARRKLFEKYPPKTVYVFSGRVECAKNGQFTGGSAVAYAWFVWEKGFTGDPIIRWVN